MSKIDAILKISPVMPIMVIEDASTAGEVANALFEGGVKVAEVTLRTPAALDAIREMKRAAPEMCIGAGTVLTSRDVGQAINAGAEFLVTPGITGSLLDALQAATMPCLPGACTPSEVASLMLRGGIRQKFFPAEPSGGAAWVAAMQGPFPSVTFCPTGGISRELAPEYLRLPNVACVGGSWVAPAKAIAAHNWTLIADNARAVMDMSA